MKVKKALKNNRKFSVKKNHKITDNLYLVIEVYLSFNYVFTKLLQLAITYPILFCNEVLAVCSVCFDFCNAS